MELCFTEWHAALFILGKTCIFFLLWGLTRVMIRIFAEEEGGGQLHSAERTLGTIEEG